MKQIKDTMWRNGWFNLPGAYVLVDGAFGSTGKGALAALIGALFGDKIDVVTTNAGPNSGHTGYMPQVPDKPVCENIGTGKIVTQQIPVLGVVSRYLFPGHPQIVYLNGGAVIDNDILAAELHKFGPFDTFMVHPNAAVIDHDHRDNIVSLNRIASTGKGVGQAIARKVLREDCTWLSEGLDPLMSGVLDWNWKTQRVFVETAQGFSLGINSQFYPFVTSRNTTVMQAIADAEIPVSRVQKVIACYRTYPIRVGSTDLGSSGGWYSDHQEITWEELGQTPEITTVTKRVRRVATWSRKQFVEGIAANEPNALFLNFVQYLKEDARQPFIRQMISDYRSVLGKNPDFTLLGYGPRPEDVLVWNE